ncbi:MAG: hypothetical protein ACTSUN_06020 [Promethearchaeota archaeon]
MKETSKYNQFRFVGNIHVDEIQPWFDFDKSKPWDESEVPWILENKVRREILIFLAKNGGSSLDEIHKHLNFSPAPLLISSEEYVPKVKFQWTKETIENHLLNLEWYKLVRKEGLKYHITFPIFFFEQINDIEETTTLLAKNWIKIIMEAKNEIEKKLKTLPKFDVPLQEILLEKTIEKLHDFLKEENLLPDVPNIKTLWAEQLRKIKFEEWIAQNF